MLNKDQIKELLVLACSTGADFAELYFENTYTQGVNVELQKVMNVSKNNIHGVGLRLLKGLDESYGYTNDTSYEGVLKLVNQLKGFYNSDVTITDVNFEEEASRAILDFSNNNRSNAFDLKTEYCLRITKASKDLDPKIIQAVSTYSEHVQEVLICNTNGVFVTDERNQARFTAMAVALDGTNKQSGSAQYGGNLTIDGFKDFDFEELGEKASKQALVMLEAEDVVGGVYDVVINNCFGGVIFHEACGHGLEASSVARGLSVFANKLGEKVAADCVTAIDDGTIVNEWGSLNYDDEGHKTNKNVLIENGVLKSYMVDFKNTRLMDHKATGSGRRESYKYCPTSRMTNTYIDNGPYEFEDLIKATKYGIFAKDLGGGQVNPATGEYNFGCNEAYLIEDGKITKPLKGVTLIGNGAETLMKIDMVANNREFGYGMCGSASGSVHACVGQPTIRVRNMTVGGNGGK